MPGALTGLRVERTGAVVTVTIDRPAVKNALAPETIRELARTCG